MGTIGKGVLSCRLFVSPCSARVLLHNIISVKFSLPLTNTAIDQGYSLVNFWGGVMLEDLKEEVYGAYCSAVLFTTGRREK